MSLNCDVQTLVDQAKCLQCIPPGMEMSALIAALCQISTTGGGSGTVASFSSGDLSPLFTTSVATATTTPALSFALNTQNANKVFAGPTTGADAAPTFRALVNSDLGTTLTPQFTRIGIGVAADAAIPMVVNSVGGGQPAIKVTRNGDDPYISISAGAAGGYLQYLNGTNTLKFGFLSTAGNATLDGGTGIFDVSSGFSVGGNPGATGSFDATNTVSVVGGIVTGWV